MSKAIFVMDMPSTCGMCPMSGTDVCRKWNMKDLCEFPKGCPLLEVPKKMAEETRWFDIEYAKGWNACIDKILGGEKNEE